MALDIASYAARVRVTDGAWGTQLQSLGLPPGACPELWNVENPAAVERVARGYVEAGSDVILTNTFGGNRFVLAGHGAAGRAAELTAAGVAISRRAAAGTDVLVFASLGPTGKLVMLGDVAPDEIAAAFAECAAAAADQGADAVVLETFNELAELELALRGARAGGLPVVACMTFASGPRRQASMMGDRPEQLAEAGKRGRAAAVGANCGVGPDNYVAVARTLAAAGGLPVWIKANAGLPQIAPGGRTVFPMGPEQFASHAPALVEAGAAFIGGCCGTTPDHIRAVRAALKATGR